MLFENCGRFIFALPLLAMLSGCSGGGAGKVDVSPPDPGIPDTIHDPAVLPITGSPCHPDAVPVGPVCIDRYENSVWTLDAVPLLKKGAVRAKVVDGTIKLQDLIDAGAKRIDEVKEDIPGYPELGNPTADLVAVSLEGVVPSTHTSWLQAEMACRLSGKRLPTNAEWTAAVMGTPTTDTDDKTASCATNTLKAQPSGSRKKCKSRWGAFDLVGNVWEWTAEWVVTNSDSSSWGGWQHAKSATSQNDALVIADQGAITALQRGGCFESGPEAGVFATRNVNVGIAGEALGFRCAR